MANKRRTKPGVVEEGENPFWVSFADLMTSLMTVFLVMMAVTVISVTKQISAEDKAKIEREADIKAIMIEIKELVKESGVEVNENLYRINFGDKVKFDKGSYSLSVEDKIILKKIIPVIIEKANSPKGLRWIKRVVVEGYTDDDGSYLYNLGLSLNRSKSVVCALLTDNESVDERSLKLSPSQLEDIQRLFLVGGFSFNSTLSDKASSRRVELKLEFLGVDDPVPIKKQELMTKSIGVCT